jgi:hypothetical protein
VRLYICGSYAIASDHAVFPAATIKTNKMVILKKLIFKQKIGI